MSKHDPISDEQIEQNLKDFQKQNRFTEAAFWIVLFAVLVIGFTMLL